MKAKNKSFLISAALSIVSSASIAATPNELANKALDCSAISFILTSATDSTLADKMTKIGMTLGQIYSLYKMENGEAQTNGSIITARDQRARALGLVWDAHHSELQDLEIECDLWIPIVFKAINIDRTNAKPALLSVNLKAPSAISPENQNAIRQVVDGAMMNWTEHGRITSADVREMLRRDLGK